MGTINCNQKREKTVFFVLCLGIPSCTPGIPYIIGLSSFQVKKHIKQGEGHTGGIFSIEAPLHVSNVQVVDPVTGYIIWYLIMFYYLWRYCFYIYKTFNNTMFIAGNHVRLDTSIWKMGPKSGLLEGWMHLVLWSPGQKFWRREENQDLHHVCLVKKYFI